MKKQRKNKEKTKKKQRKNKEKTNINNNHLIVLNLDKLFQHQLKR
jgi:hypothetical protein